MQSAQGLCMKHLNLVSAGDTRWNSNLRLTIPRSSNRWMALLGLALASGCEKPKAGNVPPPSATALATDTAKGLTTVAEVNGEPLRVRMPPSNDPDQRKAFLDQEIYRFAMLQRAKKAGVQLSDEEIAAKRQQEPTPAQLADFLASEGRTLDDFHQQQNQIALIQKMEAREVFSKVQVPEAQIREEIEKNRSAYTIDRADLRLLMVHQGDGAALDPKVRTAGGAFDGVATQLGGDAASVQVGVHGEILSVDKAPKSMAHPLMGPVLQADEKVLKAIFEGPVNTTYGPLQQGGDAAWIFVAGRKNARQLTDADIRPLVEAKLKSEASAKAMADWMERVWREADVRLVEPAGQPAEKSASSQ
jgi:hypothetical protein